MELVGEQVLDVPEKAKAPWQPDVDALTKLSIISSLFQNIDCANVNTVTTNSLHETWVVHDSSEVHQVAANLHLIPFEGEFDDKMLD